MAAQTYREIIYQTMKLPCLDGTQPENQKNQHFIGTFKPAHSPEAIEAVVNHDLKMLRSGSKRCRHYQAVFEEQDYLSFPEYQEALAKLKELITQFDFQTLLSRKKLLLLEQATLRKQIANYSQEAEEKIAHQRRLARARRQTLYTQASFAATSAQSAVIQSRIGQTNTQFDRDVRTSIDRRKLGLEGRLVKIQQKLDELEERLQPTGESKKYQLLVKRYDLNVYQPNLTGYLNYLRIAAPALHRYLHSDFPVHISESHRRLHSYITAGSGAGKSELLKTLIYSYVTNPDSGSQVIIDPHGSLADEIAIWPEVAESERLVFITTADKKFTPTINPFELSNLSEKSVDTRAQQLCSVFQELIRKDGKTDITANMKALLIPCLSVLLRLPDTSLADLQTFLNDQRNQRLHREGLKLPEHRAFFQDIFYNKFLQPTKHGLYMKILGILNSTTQRRLFVGPCTFDFENLVDQGKIIICHLPLGEGEEASILFGSFLLAMLQSKALQRYEQPRSQHVPIHLFVDECHCYLTESVGAILTGTRKYGLHLTLAQQFFGQKMSNEIADSVLNSTGVKIAGNNNKLTSAERSIGVDGVEIKKLNQGEFFIKLPGNIPALKIKAPDTLLGKCHRVSWEKWQNVYQTQLKKYYRPVTSQKATNDQKSSSAPTPPAFLEADFV